MIYFYHIKITRIKSYTNYELLFYNLSKVRENCLQEILWTKKKTQKTLRRKWEDKVRCDVCLCKTRQDEHKSNMNSNGGLQGDPIEAFETKWGLVGTSLAIQGYKVYKLSMTKTLKQSI